MKASNNLCGAAVALWLVFPIKVSAQFYAPDTEYHDPVQRVFVVEAARVLAWLAGLHGTNLTEVTYQLTTKPSQTVWEIHWLDASRKPAKSAVVSYPAERLKAGPEFYRAVFKQLWMAGWSGLSPMTPKETRELFWRGAEGMGSSREEGLMAALHLLPKSRTSDWNWLPQLAGLLTHASLPTTADRLTLDPVILARGATWLAIAEQAGATSMDDLWTPVLFQAGRERMATEIWGKAHPVKLEKTTAQQAGWNIWLRKPTSKEVFLFATESTNFSMAMPMLAYDVLVNGTGQQLGDLITDLAGSRKQLSALHNYAPLFATRTSISGGHILNGGWAVFSRLEWLKLISAYEPTVTDYRDYASALQTATNTLSKKPAIKSDRDASLIGFMEMAALLRLAHKEGLGMLTPTAVVTARDILNYGWEMTGLQMGSRYSFVAHRWGIPEQGETIFKITTGELDGLMPFFKSSKNAKLYNYAESLLRLQMVDGFFRRVGYNDSPFGSNLSQQERARLLVKRCWLRPRDFEWQARNLWDGEAIGEIPDLADALHDHGGSLATVEILNYLDSLKKEVLQKIPRGAEMMNLFAESLPQPSQLYVRCVYTRKFQGLHNFERAQEVEKIYWRNPDSGLEDRVFRNYVVAGAFESARRFYTQARRNLIDPVSFSNNMGKTAYVTGYCLKDPAMRKMALDDSASGSFSDMTMHVWDAAVQDNSNELEQGVRDLIERYESNKGSDSAAKRLMKFLPLLPAVRDPNNRAHEEALRHFGKDDSWVVLRWIWIEKFKLKTNDAVTFLGGRESGLFQHVLICYLDQNKPAMLDALNQFFASRTYIDEKSALGNFLYYKLLNETSSHKDIDLKPANSLSLREAVLSKLKSTRQGKF
ncbi:MAG: hypothetical protein HY298_26325 [Verrucomicrobia bacterium]|nr:hypothetical protein [Verrucomicrobiota bacterium]